MRYADLDRELTERVFAARDERRARGRWPSATVESTVCEGLVWQQRPDTDDSLTIASSAKPFLTDDRRRQWSVHLEP